MEMVAVSRVPPLEVGHTQWMAAPWAAPGECFLIRGAEEVGLTLCLAEDAKKKSNADETALLIARDLCRANPYRTVVCRLPSRGGDGTPVLLDIDPEHAPLGLFGRVGRAIVKKEAGLQAARDADEVSRVERETRHEAYMTAYLAALPPPVELGPRALSDHARSLVPADIAQLVDDLQLEREGTQRATRLTDRVVQCAICTDKFHPDVSDEWMTNLVPEEHRRYCVQCFCDIQTGILDPREDKAERLDAVTEAIRILAAGWGGVPSRSQLSGPVRGVGPTERDRVAVLRMALPHLRPGPRDDPRRLRPWSDWLHRAGLMKGGWRPSWGTYITASDGHPCRSLFELHVDDWMYSNGIDHELNTTGLRADWRLADGTFVEAAGLTSAEYQAKLQRKQSIAARYGIELVVLTPADLPHLAERLATPSPAHGGAAQSCAP